MAKTTTREEQDKLVIGLIFLILFAAFVLPPLIEWVVANWLGILIFLILIIIWAAYYFYNQHKISQQREVERLEFESQQKAKGLISFVDRNYEQKWGTPSQVIVWKRVDDKLKEKESLPYKVATEIEEFHPARTHLKNEYSYQLNLHGYLLKSFPNAIIEQQKGSSRPDIVVGDVAIEIKGPTGKQELQTIADKLLRYSQHFNDIIIVLFEMQHVNQRYLDEWKNGIQRQYPKAKVIIKAN